MFTRRVTRAIAEVDDRRRDRSQGTKSSVGLATEDPRHSSRNPTDPHERCSSS